MIFEAEKYSIRNKRHVKFTKEDGLFTDAIFENTNERQDEDNNLTAMTQILDNSELSYNTPQKDQ